MDFGKYKKALRAATRPTHLRKVVYNPSIDDTDVDFPDIENSRMFQEGGVVQREGFFRGSPPPEGSEEYLKIYLKNKKVKSWEDLKDRDRFAFKESFPKYQKQQELIKGKTTLIDLAKKLDTTPQRLRDYIRRINRKDATEGAKIAGKKIIERLGNPISFDQIVGTPRGTKIKEGAATFLNMPSDEDIEIIKSYLPNKTNVIQYDIMERMKKFTSGKKGEKFLKILETESLSSPTIFKKINKLFPNYTPTQIATAVTRIAQVADGQKFRAVDFIEPNPKLAKKLFKEMAEASFNNPFATASYQTAIKELDKKLKGNKSVSFRTYRSYINKEMEKIGIDPEKFNIDEYFGVSMGGLKQGFAPYSVFSRAMQADINSGNLANFQGTFSRYIDMIDAQPNKKAKFKEIDRINKIINAREKELGVELPKFYKGTAEQAFGKKRFKELTEQGLDFTTDRDYAIKIPKGALTQKEFLRGLKNKDANVLLQATKDASSAKIENLNVKDQIANKLRKDTKLLNAVKEKYKTRCGLQEGEDAAACMARNLLEDAKKIETGNATQRMVVGNRFKDIVRKGGRNVKDGLRVIQKGLSAGVGGLPGLIAEGILEALLVGWDMSANAAPLDEALQTNTLLASGAVEFLPEGELKESLGGGLVSGPSAERLKIEKAIEGNDAAQRYDQAKQALDEYDTLKKRVENLSRTQLGEDYGAYQEALQKFKEYEEELMFLGDMDEYRKILTPGSYESNEYKRVMTEQASERTGQAYRDRELGMNEGLVDPAAVEQARAEEFKDQTEMIYGNDITEEEFMNRNRNSFYKFFGEKFGNPELQPGQSKFADNVIDMHLRDQYKNDLKLFEGIRRQQYAGGGLTRRGFLKLVGGLGALGAGLKSGLIKLKSTVAKQTLENAPKGTPDWFAPLVDKIKTQGKDMSDTLGTIERESVTVLKVPVLDKLDQPIKVQRSKSGVTIEEDVTDTYTLYENPDTGEISVRVNSDAGVNNMPVDFNMTPTKITGTTDDGKPIVEPGEFVVVEERAVGRQVGPDDYDIDLDEYVTNDLDDAASDWHSVEEFATGKTDRTAQTKKRVRKEAIEDDPTEDVVSRQGELMDYNQGDDYD